MGDNTLRGLRAARKRIVTVAVVLVIITLPYALLEGSYRTYLDAYEKAERIALDWQSDAVLYEASAHEGDDNIRIEEGDDGDKAMYSDGRYYYWEFTFISELHNSTIDRFPEFYVKLSGLDVNTEERLSWPRHHDVDWSLINNNSRAFRIDSDEVFSIIKGNESFINWSSAHKNPSVYRFQLTYNGSYYYDIRWESVYGGDCSDIFYFKAKINPMEGTIISIIIENGFIDVCGFWD